MAEKPLREKVRNAFAYREDHHAQLARFLQRGHLPARLANFAFNTTCKTIRQFRYVIRRLEKAGGKCPAKPRAGTCALIAEMGIPQCVHYRVTGRVAQLRRLGWNPVLRDWRDQEGAREALQLADCALFYRIPMAEHGPDLYAEARRLGLPILYDIDDLIFHKAALAAHISRLRLRDEHAAVMLNAADAYLRAMEASDALLVSTPALGAYAAATGRPHFVVRNAVSDDLVHLTRTLPTKKAGNEIVRVFYGSGSDTHDADFALIAEALCQAMQKDSRLHLYIHGHLELPAELSCLAGRVHRVPFLDKTFYFRLCADYDMALAPLLRDAFNDAKSNIKYQEASLFGIPSIVSPAAEFTDAVTEGRDGFIARTPEEWRDKILLLAACPALRERMGQKARQNVLTRYASAVVARNDLLPALPPMASPHRERVLLVSVMFGRRSMGGAALIVMETALELQQRGFEIWVFSTEYANDAPHGALVRRDWRGIKVFSVNFMPGEIGQETRSGTLFRAVLRTAQPGLVHFHCIEGLGTGLPQECIRQSIPYAITMHDAWWVCPRQFMLDPAGDYCGQSAVDPQICHIRCGLEQEELWRRAVHMREAVAGAQTVFTPSDFYTSFISRNFPRHCAVLTNRNGINRPKSHRPARMPGPLRLGYLGGKARWKGYFFLAEALRELARDDYEVLLVDLGTVFGTGDMNRDEDRALWEGLHARVLPFVRHEDIDSLYRQMDVLLFPSLWNESFGLTVREAIARDVFVLSSDCGGPGEAIVHGENGLLFPKGDLAAFRKQLHCVLDEQETFKNYRASNTGDLRSLAAQAEELADAYRRILQVRTCLRPTGI